MELAQRNVSHEDECEVLLRAEGLQGEHLDNVPLDLRKGEVLGAVGFPGSGAREFCRALFGVHPISRGEIFVDGRDATPRSPKEALKKGIAYISFDRHREGIMPTMDIDENIGISSHEGKLRQRFGFIDVKRRHELSSHYRDSLNVKCNHIYESMDSLSGGNQQKVIVGRLLGTNPKLLILDEPTVGIDIKSREEIISAILNLAREGMGAVYLTNDYEELLRVADRLAFFDEGRLVTVLDNDGVTIEELTKIRDRNKEERQGS